MPRLNSLRSQIKLKEERTRRTAANHENRKDVRTKAIYLLEISAPPEWLLSRVQVSNMQLFNFKRRRAARAVNEALKNRGTSPTLHAWKEAFVTQALERTNVDVDSVAKVMDHQPETLEASSRQWRPTREENSMDESSFYPLP